MEDRSNQEYEWAPFDVRRLYAEKLDYVLPQHDVLTTTAWIKFAAELAGETEEAFRDQADMLLAAFKEISENYSPQAVATVYAIIRLPNKALLANEIIAAAAYAEQGMSAQGLSNMAEFGAFMDEPYPELPSVEEEKVECINGLISM